jgi:hypothetical protein
MRAPIRASASRGTRSWSIGKDAKLARGDSCGCVMSARFMIAAFILSTGWYSWRWLSSGMSLLSAFLHILVLSFLAAMAGKILGIAFFAYRAHNRPANSGQHAPSGRRRKAA